MQTSEVTLVIPAYNEEESLRQFLPELLAFYEEQQAQLVVVNDCSKDRTGAMLDEAAEDIEISRAIFEHRFPNLERRASPNQNQDAFGKK